MEADPDFAKAYVQSLMTRQLPYSLTFVVSTTASFAIWAVLHAQRRLSGCRQGGVCLVEERWYCNSPASSPITFDGMYWTPTALRMILGSALLSTALQSFRILETFWKTDHNDAIDQQYNKNVRSVSLIMLVMSILNTVTQVLNIVLQDICVDAFGLKTLVVQWIEWIISVPLMVYIVLTLEVNKTKLTTREGACVVCTLIALILASSSSWTVVAQAKNGSLLAIASAIFTMGFVYVNFAYIIRETQTSVKSVKTGSMDQIQDLRTIIHRTAQLKISGLCYLYFALSIFPLVFIAKWSGLLTDDIALAIVVFFSFYVKHCFNAYIIDKQVDMLNPTTYVLHRERANNDSRRAFLRYVLHEVRVPLNSISMGLALLGMNQEVMTEEAETVDMMAAAVGFMSDTLNEVLSMQKIEEGKLEMHYVPCNLMQIAHKVHMTLMGQLKGKDLKWVFIPPPSDVVDVIADNFRIEHVLSNLAGNAIKFSPRGAKITCKIERDPLVTDRVDENGGTIVSLIFSIYDEGLGIKPEEQKSLFKKFSQIDSGLELQEGKGSGMGLHICKEIISLHGGFVGVNSPSPLMPAFSANKGSQFYFSLPLLLAPSDSTTSSVTVVTAPPLKPQTMAPSSPTGAACDPAATPVASAVPAAPAAPAVPAISAVPAVPVAHATAAPASSSSGSVGLCSLRCLVVDDVKSNRMLLGMLLTKRGILNDQVDDGETCIKAVKAQTPGYYDFVFIDNYMPIMGGLEAIRVLRSDPSCDFFIIGLTGNSDDEDMLDFLRAGADLSFCKPLSSATLDSVINFCKEHGAKSVAQERMLGISSARTEAADKLLQFSIPPDAFKRKN